MKSIYLILNWVTGLFFILLGLLFIFFDPFSAGIPFIILSFLFLPPIQKVIIEKTKKNLSITVKALSIVMSFILSMTLFTLDMSDKAEASMAKQNQINEFTQNKQQIIDSLQKNFEAKNYHTVISEIDKHTKVINDQDLNLLRVKAEKGVKVEKVLSELEKLPEEDTAGQIKGYQALLKLVPDNQDYKDKLAYFEKTAKAQHLAQIEKELRKKESKLLSELENLAEDDMQGQVKSYQALVNLLPDNQEYKDKLAYFEKAAEAQRLAQIEKELRKKESTLLSKLENLAEDDTQGQIKSYQALVKLLPDNEEYKDKLAHFEKVAEAQRLARIKQENKKKEQEILAHLKTLKKDDTQGNINAYKQLTELFPNNEKYKKKFTALSKAENEKKLFEYRTHLISFTR